MALPPSATQNEGSIMSFRIFGNHLRKDDGGERKEEYEGLRMEDWCMEGGGQKRIEDGGRNGW